MARLKKATAKPEGGMELAFEREKEACEALGEPFNEENFQVEVEETPEDKLSKLIPEYKVKLSKLLPDYLANKSEMDSYKKLVDKDNKEIKLIMLDSNLSKCTVGDIKATCSVSEREDFIEEALIVKLKEMKIRGIVKKKEYVDMDALENAIYNGKIDAALLADCQTKKEVVTLRVTKLKRKED